MKQTLCTNIWFVNFISLQRQQCKESKLLPYATLYATKVWIIVICIFIVVQLTRSSTTNLFSNLVQQFQHDEDQKQEVDGQIVKTTNTKTDEGFLQFNYPSWIQLFLYCWFSSSKNSLDHRYPISNRYRPQFSCYKHKGLHASYNNNKHWIFIGQFACK